MKPSEIKNIVQKLPELIQETLCSEVFLSIFLSNKILTAEDIETIKENHCGDIKRSSKFYSIIQKRSDAYNILLKALEETRQTDAITTLLKNNVPERKIFKKYFGLPEYMDEFLSHELDLVLIVSSKDCRITCERLLELTPQSTCYTTSEFYEWLSMWEVPVKPGSVRIVNCENEVESVFEAYQYECFSTETKIILVTSTPLKDLKIKDLPISNKQKILPRLAKDSIQWNDLTALYQQELKQSLQKQLLIELDKTLYCKIDYASIVDLINRRDIQFFKDALPTSVDHYIPRHIISRRVVSKRIFNTKDNDIFVFEGIERHQLTTLAKITETSSNLVDIPVEPNSNFVILESSHHYKQICSRFKDRPVHLLEFVHERVVWKESCGSIENIQIAVEQHQPSQSEDEFFSQIVSSEARKADPICISDSPGMGKTVLLAHFARELAERKTRHSVAFVVITDFVQKVKSIVKTSRITHNSVISALADYLGNNLFGIEYIKRYYKQIDEILLDGFDELTFKDIHMGYECLSILRSKFPETRIWVTTRPHLLLELELKLGVLGYNIMAFRKEEQKKVLTLFWSLSLKDKKPTKKNLEMFANRCLDLLHETLNDIEKSIAGIPLQCLLIAEVFRDEAKQFCENSNECDMPINIKITCMVDLYEQFVNKKFDTFQERYGRKVLERMQLLKIHYYLSIVTLFPAYQHKFQQELCPSIVSDKQIHNVGILESQILFPTPRFIHRTFAEYFIAKFVTGYFGSGLNQDVIEFLHKEILYTIPTTIKIFDSKVNSADFKQKIICYFIDALLALGAKVAENQFQHPKFQHSHTEIANACVHNGFVYLFSRFVKNYITFIKWKQRSFTDLLIKVAVLRSNVRFLKALQTETACGRNLHTIMHGHYTVLHLAVIRGDYSIVEELLKEDGPFLQPLSKNNKTFKHILHECVRDIKNNSAHILKEKISIIRLLTTFNKNILTSKKKGNKWAIECDRISLSLIIEILKIGRDVYKSQNLLTHIFQTLPKTLSFSKYIACMYTIFPNKGNDIVNSELISLMESNPEIVEFRNSYPNSFQSGFWGDINLHHEDYKSITLLYWLFNSFAKNLRTLIYFLHKHFKHKPMCSLVRQVKVDTCKELTDDEVLKTSWWNISYGLSFEFNIIHGFLRNGLDVDIKDNNFKTCIDYLVNGDCTEYTLKIFTLLQNNSNQDFDELERRKVFWIFKSADSTILDNLIIDYCSNVDFLNGMDYSGNNIIHYAVNRGSRHLSCALRFCQDVNAANKNGETPLHLLTSNEYFSLKCWKLLISNKADLSALDKHNKTPITNLLLNFSDDNSIVVALVHAKVNCAWFRDNPGTMFRDSEGNALLHLAAKTGNELILKTIFDILSDTNKLTRHQNIEAANSSGDTSLHIYISCFKWNFSLNCWKHFIDNGADLWALNKNMETPIDCLIKILDCDKSCIEALKYLGYVGKPLEDIRQTLSYNNERNTMLHLAAKMGSKTAMKIVLDMLKNTKVDLLSQNVESANKNTAYFNTHMSPKNCRKETPLHLVLNRKNKTLNIECWKLLIDNNADIFAEDESGNTPLCWLNYLESDDITEAIKYTITHTSSKNQVEKIMWLVIKKLALNYSAPIFSWYKNCFNENFKEISISYWNEKVSLLNASFLDLCESTQKHVIDYFACTDSLFCSLNDCVSWCLKTTEITDESKVKYLKILCFHHHLLRQLRSRNQNTIYPLSSVYCQCHFVKHLVHMGFDINERNSNDDTPLHIALTNGGFSRSFVEELLNHGADANALNKKQQSPLQLSLQCNEICDMSRIICLLIENKADPRNFDSSGNNIIHLAAKKCLTNWWEFSKITESVTKHGYAESLRAKNDQGLSPLQLHNSFNQFTLDTLVQTIRKKMKEV